MKKRVIVIDDCRVTNATVEASFSKLIKAGTVEFKAYTNPKDLHYKLMSDDPEEQESYDLLICDINMPKMTGLELIVELMEHDTHKHKPVLVLTTEEDKEVQMIGEDLGVHGWIVKPFEPTNLIKRASNILGL